LRIKLGERTLRVRYELNEGSRGAARLALGKIRWNGNCRSAHLRYQSEFFLARERLGEPLHSLCELHSFLPNYQVLIIPDELGVALDFRQGRPPR
jgi:hypothetical protein